MYQDSERLHMERKKITEIGYKLFSKFNRTQTSQKKGQ